MSILTEIFFFILDPVSEHGMCIPYIKHTNVIFEYTWILHGRKVLYIGYWTETWSKVDYVFNLLFLFIYYNTYKY